MRTRHIYALFSNALRNAIEAVRKVEMPEMKLIDVNVEADGGEVIITVRNYCAAETVSAGDTSKGDLNHHGFGLQSMQYIADQYHGSLATQTHGRVFVLCVRMLIPNET